MAKNNRKRVAFSFNSLAQQRAARRYNVGLGLADYSCRAVGSLSPDDVLVELFADKSGAPPFRQRMSLERSMPESNGTYEFKGMVSAERSASDYTVRIVPFHADVHIPLETNRVVWET